MPNVIGRTTTRVAASVLILLAIAAAPQAQKSAGARLTSPKEQFGWEIGDDYRLVNYTQYVEYLRKLDQQSDRMTVVEIGKTEEGRPELTAIITSPENHKKLAQYKDINRKLALAEVNDEQARQLAKDGKTVVWIDGGLHATEVLGAQQLIETIYRLNSKTDPETMRILNDDIILCTLINPDGMELVSNWYMRDADEKKRTTSGIPRLYQKYIGHDDNRDFYMANMSESVNANRVMYREWYPAIMYNHHQTGPAGAVLFAPPFRDPFNYNFDPLIPLGIDMVGSAIHTRLAAEGKPGAVMRSGAPVLDLVQRWHSDDLVFPQPDRHFDGNDRQSDTGRNSVRARNAVAARGRAESNRASDVALQAVDRVLGHEQLRDSRHRVGAQGRFPVQHVQDGAKRHRQRQPRHLDHSPEADQSG